MDSTIWVIISYAYTGLLQVIAIFMAFHTRKVRIKALNDSKEIAVIIYINILVLTALIVADFSLKWNHQDAHAAVFGLALLIEGTLLIGFLFIPKVCSLKIL